MAAASEDPFHHCLTTLRQTDFDRYLACLLLPEDKRGPVAALYAFNAELARVRELVRDPLPGEIRLQWWRDLLEGSAAGDASANPIAAGLMRTIDTFRLPRTPLATMTEARIFDLYDDPMPDRQAFELYAGETASALIQLTALVLDAEAAPSVASAAGHAGIAQLVAGCLLLLPYHRSRHQIYIPGDILAATGLTAETFLAGEERNRIAAAIAAFSGFGRDHLRKARAESSSVKGGVKAAFLPVSLAESVFAKAERAGADLLDRPLHLSPLGRQWRLWRASRRKAF
ncbi:phytoene/squalene synthase family protein [Rhizobium alvei]|uniref:Phytoene/squalene synthase family protein n=1 Tax=Rhizobium alvei TaxID=1132659 RepID=A0ABT8YJQ5_9HYPH|nr:phytoene/squalene synthase family protein [Rhizobium alvei]MDO6963897.1 phytoene/squalene synthase family protein [Rhizobium alvei]